MAGGGREVSILQLPWSLLFVMPSLHGILGPSPLSPANNGALWAGLLDPPPPPPTHTQSPVSHQFHAQRMSTGIALLSESEVSVTLVLCKFYVHWNGGVTRSARLNVSQSPWLHSCTQWMSGPDAALSSEITSQSLPGLSFMHTAMSAEWCCQAGSSKHHHLSSIMFHTVTHTHKVYNEKWCYYQRSPITAMSCQHRRPLPSHTNSQSWWFTHARSKPSAQSSETTGAVTVCLLTFPSCAQWTACWCHHSWFTTDRHTPHGQLRMPCTPLGVCAPSPASQSGQHPHSLTLNGTVQVQSPHTPMVRSGMPCTPLRVCTPPHRFPIQANTLTAVKLTVQAPHTHPIVSSRMPCNPLRVCASSSGFPIWANTLTAVKCNCAGSPHPPPPPTPRSA